jgi:DNA-directed RNA polymerase specialized sigma24 family protein
VRRQRREQTISAQTLGWFDPCPGNELDAEAAQQALQTLPARQREIVLLRVWSEMTLSDVSQVTGLPISTVHDEYRRGLSGIRRIMETPCTTTQSQPKR